MRRLDLRTMIVMLAVFGLGYLTCLAVPVAEAKKSQIPEDVQSVQAQKCDAHIELTMFPDCLERRTGWGRGTLVIQNLGNIGNSQLEVALQLTYGIGNVSFSYVYRLPQLTLILEPSQQYVLHFLVDIDEETRRYFPEGARVNAVILDEDCNPDLNQGVHVQQAFPWCKTMVYLPLVVSSIY